MSTTKVSIYGAGKVAWNLGKWFRRADVEVQYVYNRTHEAAQELASIIQAKATKNLKDLMRSDVVILMVSDDAIREVAHSLPQGKAIIAHTSGNTSLDALFPHNRRAVIYPLQTFSREVKVDMKHVPFLMEANTKEVSKQLNDLIHKLSPKVYSISGHQRRRLHVAAVFANNFVNHMYKNAYDICNENDIPFEVLIPLIKQTAEKVKETNPIHAQTGPAMRGDKHTIKKHVELLEGDQKELYELITASIEKTLTDEEL